VNALDDAQAIRRADADLLSLALIDARNRTLNWLAAFEARLALSPGDGGASPLWLAARAGAYQDRWIARNLQRQRGEACDPAAPGLAPADAAIEAWLDGTDRGQPGIEADALRGWLAQTLDVTLELLGAASPGDAALHFFRLALLHEDRLGEAFAERAAELQLALEGEPPLPQRALPARPAREALWLPAQRLELGSPFGGTVPENERWMHAVDVPDFEIDAQAVSWAPFVEFAEDGGYDRRELWSDAGWTWLQSGPQAEARRAPRHVEQLRGGVLALRQGRLQRVALGQPVLHASRFEAEAWCRWAGRRLPTEPEWELAALTAGARGFVWGDVFEWVSGSARAWPGHATGPGSLDRMPPPGTMGVLRGASWMTRLRRRHPKARRFALPACDTIFCGFRSCAL